MHINKVVLFLACKRMCGELGEKRKEGNSASEIRVYLIDKLKISEVGDKREYRIYRNSIGDREIFSDKI